MEEYEQYHSQIQVKFRPMLVDVDVGRIQLKAELNVIALGSKRRL